MKNTAEVITEAAQALVVVVAAELRSELVGLLKALVQAGIATITALSEAAQAWLHSKSQVTTIGGMHAVI